MNWKHYSKDDPEAYGSESWELEYPDLHVVILKRGKTYEISVSGPRVDMLGGMFGMLGRKKSLVEAKKAVEKWLSGESKTKIIKPRGVFAL